MSDVSESRSSRASGWAVLAAIVATFNVLYTYVAYVEVNNLAAYCFELGGAEPWPGCLEAGGRLQYNAVFLLPLVINGLFALAAGISAIAGFVSWIRKRRERLPPPA